MFQDFVLFIQENKSAYLIARKPGLWSHYPQILYQQISGADNEE